MWSPGNGQGDLSNEEGQGHWRARGRGGNHYQHRGLRHGSSSGPGSGVDFFSPHYYPQQQQQQHIPGMPLPTPAPMPMPMPAQWQYYPSSPFNGHGGEHGYPSFPPPPLPLPPQASPNDVYQSPSQSYTVVEYQGRNRGAGYRQDNAGYRQDYTGYRPSGPRQDHIGYRPPGRPHQDTSCYRSPGNPRQDTRYQDNTGYRLGGPRQDNIGYQENGYQNTRYRPPGGPCQDNTGYRPHNPIRYQDNNTRYHPDAECRPDSKKTASTSLLERGGGGGGGGSIKGLMESTPRTVRIDVTAWDKKIAVTLTNEASTVQEWVERQTGSLFGLDVEWKPNFMKGQNNKVALLQLCGDAGCLIVQMLFLDVTPPALEAFLLDSTKSFGGVGIQTDNEKLLEDHGIQCRVPVELAALAAEKTGQASLSRAGLKMLLESILGLEMKKPKKISMSNWEKWTLDLKQIEYACIDAWASFAIFHKLLNWQ